MTRRARSSYPDGATKAQPGKPSNSDSRNEHDAGGPRGNGEDKATKERNAAFLVDEFEVKTPDAAELVADDEPEADEIVRHDRERQRDKDPLEGVPAPHNPDDGPVERVQNHMQKVVRHDRKS